MKTSLHRSGLVVLSVALVTVLMAGCGGGSAVSTALGLDKKAPDEFAVYRRAPLDLPPDYGLRPPRPGAARPQETEPREAAREALYGRRQGYSSTVTGKVLSTGEQAFLIEAEAVDTDPEIRNIIDRETSILAAESESVSDRLLVFGDPVPFGRVVDAKGEHERIRGNLAKGLPLTEGETPTIDRKQKGLLEDLVR